MPVSTLPMSKGNFIRITGDLKTHRHIARVVQRNNIYLSATSMPEQSPPDPPQGQEQSPPDPPQGQELSPPDSPQVDKPKDIVYTGLFAHTKNQKPHSLAMTSTHFGRDRANCGIFFGCEDDDMEYIKKSITECESAWNHPLLLISIFLELQTKRLRRVGVLLIRKSQTIKEGAANNRKNPNDSLLSVATEAAEVTAQTKVFENDLSSTIKQLTKLISHAESLMNDKLEPTFKDFSHNTARFICRFREICHEYEETVNECRINVEEAMQATQLVSPTGSWRRGVTG